MNRTAGFFVIIFIFIASLTGFYIYLKKQQAPTSTIFNAVPVKTALLIEAKDPQSLLQKIQGQPTIWKDIEALTPNNKLATLLQQCDSLLSLQPQSIDWDKRKILLSVHETGKNSFSLLLIFKTENRTEGNQITKGLSSYLQTSGNLTERKYNQTRFSQYQAKMSKEPGLFFGIHRGIFLISNNEMLLQDAIRQTDNEEGLLQNKNFSYLTETAGDNADATIYIPFAPFEKLSKQWMSGSLLKNLGINTMGDWASLDLSLKMETAICNGFSIAQNKSNQFATLFAGQEGRNLKLLQFVPSSSEGFAAFGLSDLNLYFSKLRDYMDGIDQLSRYSTNVSQVKEAYGDQSFAAMEAIFNGELAQISNPSGSYFLVRTKGYRDAKEFIEQCLQHYSKGKQTNLNSLTYTYKLDNDTRYPIYEMPLKYLPTRMFGPWFKECEASYVTAFDDYLVFSNSLNDCKRFIYDNILEKTLHFDGDYNQFENYLAAKSNFYLFIPSSGNATALQNLLNEKAQAYFKQKQKDFRDFYALGWQFVQENDKLYNNLVLHYQPTNKIKAGTEWESRLDTLISFKPVLVTNHYTQEKEIFVQDMQNNIYLMNKSGRIIWKKKIEKPIMGEVEQVDYYKNGKLQYLFNTEDALYCLDRNGNNVERYPVKFQSKAVAPLALFDYDNRKNYRIFVPFANRSVKAFDIDGKTISGYKFSGADNNIIGAVQHFRVQNNDYLVITDESRIYITDRRGGERIKLQKQFAPSRNNHMLFQAGNSSRRSRFIRTSTDGTIYYIYLNGEVQEQKIKSFTPNHYFAFQDITGDNMSNFIFTDENLLDVYTLNGAREFKVKFNTHIVEEPSFYQFSASKKAIGVTEAESRMIYLIDQNGEIMNGFPLPGKTRFSIGILSPGSNRFNLIVGGDNQYLYNYKLN